MRIFTSADSAKQFFIDRIKEQAQRDSVPLSDVELKMLRWTEMHPIPGLPPDELVKLHQQFERECDSDEYESKISVLLQHAFEHDKQSPSKEDWKAAYEVLSKEDHYILVMIENACGSELKSRRKFLGIF